MGSDEGLAVDVSGLTMTYGARTVLGGIDLRVPRGQKVAVLGPNGAGKTTLMETLEGLRLPSAGAVSVLGRMPSTGGDAWRSRIGIVFQTVNDHRNWRVRDLLKYVETAQSLAGRGSAGRFESICAEWDLAKILAKRLKELSGGQRRRVDVAAALLSEPELLFLDEPTAGFDPAMRRVFHSAITATTPSTTMLLATHDLEEAEAVCDRIILVKDGGIVADGSPNDLRRSFTDLTTVTWRTSAEGIQERRVKDAGALVARLAQDSDVSDLEVRRGSLEEAYLAIVNQAEAKADDTWTAAV